jgi:hypothetical protein
VIFDAYSARLRALHQVDPAAEDELLLDHFERKTIVDGAIEEVDRLSALLEREVPIRSRLQSLADVAKDAGVRVSIELRRLPPEAAPRG